MDKTKGIIVVLAFLLAITAIAVIVIKMQESPAVSHTETVTQGYGYGDFPEVRGQVLKYNNQTLEDHTYINTEMLCAGENLGFSINITPCHASSFRNRPVSHEIPFTWSGSQALPTSWVFVYEGNLSDYSVKVGTPQTYQDTVYTEQYVNNYLVSGIMNYTNLGAPVEGLCDVGTANNTQMYRVTRYRPDRADGYAVLKYCFTNVSVVNSTAFRISGNGFVGSQVTKSRINYGTEVPVTFMGKDLLGLHGYSFYRVQDVTFQPGQTIYTKWTFTPNSDEGKWHILGYQSDYGNGLIDSIKAGRYIYIDPSWDRNLDSNLVAWYKFNESSGTNALDSVRAYNGSYDNTPTLNVAAKIGTGMQTSGSNVVGMSKADFGNGLTTTNAYSVTMWINATNINTDEYFHILGDAVATSRAMRVSNAETTKKISVRGTGGTCDNYGTTVISENVWHFIVLTFDGTKVNVTMDGVQAFTCTDAKDLGAAPDISVGKWFSTGTLGFKGIIDEFGVFNKTLNSSEISQLFAAGEGITYAADIPAVYPSFSNEVKTANGTAYSSGVSYYFNITIANTNGTAGIQFNGVNYSMTNSSNNFTRTITDLAAGVYPYYFWAYYNGTSYNNTAVQYYTVSKAAPSIALTTSPASPITFGTNSTFSCSMTPSLAGLQLYVNSVDKGSENGISLLRGAATYNINCSHVGNQNYSSAENLSTYTINQAAGSVSLLLNGAAANLSVSYPQQINASASGQNGSVALYKDGTNITSSNALNQTLGVSFYNITAVNSGNQNYSASTITYFANVSKGSASLSIGITPSNTVTNPTETTATGSGCPAQLTCALYRNDTGAVSNPDVQTLGLGAYLYTYNTTGNANYSASSTTQTLTVTAAPLIYPTYSSLTTSPSSPVAWSASANYQFNANWLNASSVWLDFSGRNYSASLVSGSTYRVTLSDLSAGTHSYYWWANSSDGTRNLTSSFTYNITKKAPTGSISISPATTVTYPNETTVTATESNSGDSDVVYQLFMDGSVVSNPDVQTLDVGTHTYIFNTTGGTNISAGQLATGTITVLNSSIGESGLVYSNTTFETSRETFSVNISYDSNIYTVQEAQLFYNSINYTSALTNSLGMANIRNSLDVGVYNAQRNNTFNWQVRLTDISTGSNTYFNTSAYTQTVNIINYTNCTGSINTSFINFTSRDELSNNLLTVQLSGTFFYWLGSGTTRKNYSVSNFSANTFKYCFSPAYKNLTIDSDISFTATDHATNYYYLRNASLTNTTTQITLYSLSNSQAVKFYQTVQSGVNIVDNAVVLISKKFIDTGSYQVVAVRVTDIDGKFTFWADQDQDYSYYIIDNGTYLGSVQKTAICSSAPCEQILQLVSSSSNILQPYSDAFAANVLSNITFNKSTEVVTFNFVDTTGLAHYFRFEVKKGNLNDSDVGICNLYSYTSAGTMTCNVSGYKGDFYAAGYISRSPEKIVDYITFLISNLANDLGSAGLLIVLVLGSIIVIYCFTLDAGVGVLAVPGALTAFKLIDIFAIDWIPLVGLWVGAFVVAEWVK